MPMTTRTAVQKAMAKQRDDSDDNDLYNWNNRDEWCWHKDKADSDLRKMNMLKSENGNDEGCPCDCHCDGM